MLIELNPFVNALTSSVFRLNVPLDPLPMPTVVVAVTGCTVSAPVLPSDALAMVMVSALIVSAPENVPAPP